MQLWFCLQKYICYFLPLFSLVPGNNTAPPGYNPVAQALVVLHYYY